MKGNRTYAHIPGPALRPVELPSVIKEHRIMLEALVDAHDELIAKLAPQGQAVVAGVMLNRIILAKKMLGRIA